MLFFLLNSSQLLLKIYYSRNSSLVAGADPGKIICKLHSLNNNPSSTPGLQLCLMSLMISILIWNVQGAGCKSTLRRLRKLCKIHSISVLVILEPFVSIDHLVQLRDYLHFREYNYNPSNKVWVVWKGDFVGIQDFNFFNRSFSVFNKQRI